MLRSSPTQWPDENPLLDGAARAEKAYPPWVSSEVPDPAGAGQQGDPARDAAGDEQPDATTSSAPVGWIAGVAGAALLAAVVVALVVRSRRRATTTSSSTEQGEGERWLDRTSSGSARR
jgi:hypothetical protein